jgi:hypothetical protein
MLLSQVFFNKHYSREGHHKSSNVIIKEVGRYYYHKHLKLAAQIYTQQCYHCTMGKTSSKPKHIHFNTIEVTQPRILWSFDIGLGLPTTKEGNKMIHIYVDYFSLYTIIVPMPTKTTKAIKHSFLNHIILPFTPPLALRSDGESGMTKSLEFKEFAAMMGITLMPTAARSPESNGQAENRIKQIKTLIKLEYSMTNNPNWDQDLHFLQIAMNKTIGVYGYTPEEIFFGTAVPSRLDLLQVTEPPRTLTDFMELTRINVKMIREKVYTLRDKNRRINEAWANQHRSRRTFRPGDIVKLRHKVVKANSTLNCPFRGPYLVKQVASNEHTCILENLVTGLYSRTHYNHLEHFPAIQTPTQLNSEWDHDLQQLVENMNKTLLHQLPPPCGPIDM